MTDTYEIDLGLAGKEVQEILDTALTIDHMVQPGAAVCWATCLAMVEKWKNVSKPFCTYVQRQSKKCYNCNNECRGKTCDEGRQPTDIRSDWIHFGYTETSETPDILVFPAIRDNLIEGKPVQAYFVHRDRTTAHVVLITSATKNAACDDMLLVVDPLKEKPVLIYSMQIAKWGSWERSWAIG